MADEKVVQMLVASILVASSLSIATFGPRSKLALESSIFGTSYKDRTNPRTKDLLKRHKDEHPKRSREYVAKLFAIES